MPLDYGLIGNCRTSALVSKNGAVEWCCFPKFDSPSVFAKILDRERGGSFEIRPIGKCKVSQRYLPNTNILETTFTSKSAKFKVLDYFPRYREGEMIVRLQEIHRLIRVVRGRPNVKIIFDPRFHYAIDKTSLEIENNRIVAAGNDRNLYLYSDIKLESILSQKPVTLRKEKYLVLSYERPENPSISLVKDAFKRTMWYWRFFVKRSTIPSLKKREVIRSVLLLKLLTYESGAIIAAPTTSIPEIVGTQRTWDYRYCWLRDASFTIDALFKLCHFDEAETYINWLLRICYRAGANLQPMYSIDGEQILVENSLPHLSGYKNSTPVRVGNAAYQQRQLDIYGEVIDSLYLYYEHYKYSEMTDNAWSVVYRIIEAVMSNWRQKDSGIWEFRSQLKHYTFSKLMCWVALDRGVILARQRRKLKTAARWAHVRNHIKDDIIENGWSEKKQSFVQNYGSETIDASLLLIPYFGFLPANHPKFAKTVEACERELVKGCFVYRYVEPDELGKPSNSFTICTFWYINALFMQGRAEEARNMFKKILRYGNHLDLFSEDIDPKTKELTGNFPQGYTHLALINTAILLDSGRIRRPKCNIRLTMLRE